MGCVYDATHHKYTKVVHCHQRYRYETDSEAEEENEDALAPAASEPRPSSRVMLDMLALIQSTMVEGFASMTRRFDDVLALQGSFSTQL